ncbi:MAG: DUF4331 family protein, partial [Chloroflexi bacterium]|nr:DUF4331 family protein [Chloroflexota bacterium]
MSHLLVPALAHEDMRLAITDLYLFRGQTGTVFVMNVNSSAADLTGQSEAGAAPSFHPAAHYQFHIDVDGDALEELVFRITFGPSHGASSQPIEVHVLVGPDARHHAAGGTLLAWGSTERVLAGRDGIRVWAGCAAEPFYVEPTVLEAIRRAVRLGRAVDLHAWDRGHP